MPDNLRTFAALFATIVFALMTVAMLVVALLMAPLAGSFFALVFGGLTLFSGLVLFKSFRQGRTGLEGSGVGRQEQRRILNLANHSAGRLTAEEAAVECNLSVEQAKLLLDNLVQQGAADTWVSDSGSMVYVFQGLLEDDKATAEDPMKLLEP